MRVSAILCQGNFRHWQASTPIGVVLKRRGRLRACSQRLSRRFNTIAPLGAEDWQWLFSLSCLHLGDSKSAKAQNWQWLFSLLQVLQITDVSQGSVDLAGKIYGVQFCFVLTALWSLDDRSLVMWWPQCGHRVTTAWSYYDYMLV